MNKEIFDFIKWLDKNKIVIKDDYDYMNAIYGEYLIENGYSS